MTIAREFHVVKGINYKQGQVPTMMIAVASKENWNDRNSAEKVKSTKPVVDSKLTPPARVKETTPSPPSHPNPVAAKVFTIPPLHMFMY